MSVLAVGRLEGVTKKPSTNYCPMTKNSYGLLAALSR
jgi:hypothetical protein